LKEDLMEPKNPLLLPLRLLKRPEMSPPPLTEEEGVVPTDWTEWRGLRESLLKGDPSCEEYEVGEEKDVV
jgi:hypothetical protein